MFIDKDLKRAKIDIEAELNRLEANQTAKEVAGKSIGRYGLFFITLIVVIGVAASLELDEGKMAAVMGLLGASLTALISMLNNIAGANPKQERPEFEVMKQLIDRLDRMADRDPMSVVVEGDKVTVKKGNNEIQTAK
jgi:hypothetical protein